MIVPLVIWRIVEPALLLIGGSLPELRYYIWKHPKPVKYRMDDFSNPQRGYDAEYEFARIVQTDHGDFEICKAFDSRSEFDEFF